MVKKKILVVDDEPEMVKFMRMRLEASGYEVLEAYNGKEALEKAHKEKPDLVILDIMMPELDGFGVCRKLKIDSEYKSTPIIMLTIKFQPNDIKFAEAMGADAYITKPFDDSMLLEKIEDLIGKGK